MVYKMEEEKELKNEIKEQMKDFEQSITNWVKEIKFDIETRPHTKNEYQKILQLIKFIIKNLDNLVK